MAACEIQLVLTKMHAISSSSRILYSGTEIPLLTALAQGTFVRQRLLTVVAQIDQERQMSIKPIFSRFEIIAGIFRRSELCNRVDATLSNEKLFGLLGTYCSQITDGERGSYIHMMLTVLEMFSQIERFQSTVDKFYRTLSTDALE